MRRGNGKKKIMKEMAVLIMLSVALCNCSLSSGETSEQNLTETVGGSSSPEASITLSDLRKEEFPFEGMENLTCREYDEDNILGLSAIYVSDQMLVFCFRRNDIWRDYEASHSRIDINGIDEQGIVADIIDYSMAESKQFFWVHIKKDKDGKAAGFGISDHVFGYSVYGLKETRLTVQEWDTTILERQIYENDKWGEVIKYDLEPLHVPN